MARTRDGRASGAGGILRLPDVLRRDLILLLAAKLVLLTILYALFFSPAHRPAIDIMAHIAGTLPQR